MFAPFLRHSGDSVVPREPQEIVTWLLVVVNEENEVRVGSEFGAKVARKCSKTNNQIEVQAKRVRHAITIYLTNHQRETNLH